MIPAVSLSAITQALGWTVVHSLWQIALIWLIFKVLTWRLQRQNNAVYLLALVAMLVSAVLAAITFNDEYAQLTSIETIDFQQNNIPVETRFELNAPALPQTQTAAQSLIAAASAWLENHAAPIGWAWLICAAFLWLRLLGGWWMAQRLKSRGVSLPGEAFRDLCGDWANKLRIRQKIVFLESSRIGEPLTLGFWKPVVLFPVGMLAQLSPAQAEALILHELAHIRRHDYLANLFQLALEVVFFYHPLFWLLSREARTRREYCCDDMVLRHISNPLLYAKTLTDLQLSLVHTQNHFAMKAAGKSHFTERILRIAGITPERTLRATPQAWLMIFLLPLFVCLSSWWSSAQTPPEDEAGVAGTAVIVEPENTSPLAGDTIRPGRTKIAGAEAPAPPGPADKEEQVVAVAIEPQKMNVFFIGVDNPVTVGATGYDCAALSVRLNGKGSVTPTGDCQYNINVTTPGKVQVLVFAKQNKQERLLSAAEFRVKRIPDPLAPASSAEPRYAVGKVAEELKNAENQHIVPDDSAPGQVAIQALKMNVFYIGVDNPLRVAASGIPEEELSVRFAGDGEIKGSGGSYTVIVRKPGEVTIGVYRRQNGLESLLSEQKFRVKRIPDPAPKLGGKFGSRKISKETLRNMPGVEAVLENFDFDAACEVVSYELTIYPFAKDTDAISTVVQGSAFPQKVREWFNKIGELGSGEGDRVFIDNIRIKCPGDPATRHVGGLAFEIGGEE